VEHLTGVRVSQMQQLAHVSACIMRHGDKTTNYMVCAAVTLVASTVPCECVQVPPCGRQSCMVCVCKWVASYGICIAAHEVGDLQPNQGHQPGWLHDGRLASLCLFHWVTYSRVRATSWAAGSQCPSNRLVGTLA
jgi:hypothetical protein